MSTVTWSVKVNDSQKQLINNILEKVVIEKGFNKGDSFIYILESFSNIDIGNVSGEYIKPNVRDVLQSVDCDYIEYSDELFWCLEKAHKTKKKDNIGIEPESVKRFCIACKQGKSDILQIKIEDERRKESIKKLQNFAKSFMIVTEKGFLANSYMCIRDSLEGNLSFSRDGKTLTCSLNDNDIVNIDEVCMKALNPDTELTPCQYLITLEHLVKLSKDDLKTLDLDLPEIIYEQPPVDYNKLNPKREEIEPEYEIKTDNTDEKIEEDE